jgi:phospholipid/cholesterol/gamma-HCH transport system permease protein
MSAARATAEATEEKRATVSIEPASDGVVELRLGGTWALGGARPDAASIASELLGHGARRVVLDASAVESWDSALLAWLRAMEHASTAQGVEVDRARLPEGVRRLLELAASSVESPRDEGTRPSFLARVGAAVLRAGAAVLEILGFIGRLVVALARLLTLRAQMRIPDLLRLIQDAGADAVPITTLVSVIVGLILAFVGAVQLRLFGADLYVADLVAVAMVREMGAMVVAIIMAGGRARPTRRSSPR